MSALVGGNHGRRLREWRRRGGALLVELGGRRPLALRPPDFVQDLAVHSGRALVQVVLGARGEQLLEFNSMNCSRNVKE